MTTEALRKNLFLVEYSLPPAGDRTWRQNVGVWVVTHGDARVASDLAIDAEPQNGAVVHNVRKHGGGRSVIVEEKGTS